MRPARYVARWNSQRNTESSSSSHPVHLPCARTVASCPQSIPLSLPMQGRTWNDVSHAIKLFSISTPRVGRRTDDIASSFPGVIRFLPVDDGYRDKAKSARQPDRIPYRHSYAAWGDGLAVLPLARILHVCGSYSTVGIQPDIVWIDR